MIIYEENPALESIDIHDIWEMSRDEKIRYFGRIGFSNKELSLMNNLSKSRIRQIRRGNGCQTTTKGK